MMQKGGGNVDLLVLKSGDFMAIVQQKLIDSTLSVERMETTADIAHARSIIACCEIYHCCEKLDHWRKQINFVQKLNCGGCKYQSGIVNGAAAKKFSVNGW